MSLGSRIREAREAAGLTQTAVAAHVGKAKTAIHNWENDVYKPSIADRIDLAHLLNVPFSALLPETEARAVEFTTLADPTLKQIVRLWPKLEPKWREAILSIVALRGEEHTPSAENDDPPIEQLRHRRA